jgi:CRISPR-associated endonuclease/helicase Cas3
MSDIKTLLKLWAKYRGNPPDEVVYPLLFHMLDVAVVAQEVWDNLLQSDARRLLASRLGLADKEARAWISFWAGLHDIGKASPVFQSKSRTVRNVLESQGFHFEQRDDIRHEIITAHNKVFPRLMEELFVEKRLSREMICYIGYAIGGHHGSFNHGDVGPRQRGDDMWHDARLGLTEELARLLDISSLPTPCHVDDPAFYAMLAGLTIVADWVASNEKFFPYNSEHPLDKHTEASRRQAKKAVEKLGWTVWRPPVSVAPLQELFPEIIDKLRPVQEKTIELSRKLGNNPGLVIIEAPMGEGKTEVAMYLADYWATALGQKGTYFALPTQATSNQMFTRVEKFLETRYPGLTTNLQLVHGNALLLKDFTDYRQVLDWSEGRDDLEAGVIAAEWFLPKKRGLLAPFGVGTIDQALLSVLQTRHFFVRLFGLGQKTIILDEVHAYDTYMTTLLEELISWLCALGSTVVILSATLPRNTRKALVKAYGGDPELLKASDYPRITWVSGKGAHEVKVPASRRIDFNLRRITDDLDELIDRLKGVGGGCIAIVCNTVKRAQETYEAIKRTGLMKPPELMLLHSRYPFEEREEREKAILQAFGKEGKRPEQAILVATQIIEQSLDVDFDLMVTDLAPADLVIQRAGRVHRHDNRRPDAVSKPALWIRMPGTDKEGIPKLGDSVHIYEEYTLLLSYLSLKDRDIISMPGDIQGIIEEVYTEGGASFPSPAFEKVVRAARARMEEVKREDQFKARSNLVPSPAAELSAFFSQSKELEEDNPEVHRSLQALTRLVESSVQVVCLYGSKGGIFLSEGDLNQIDIEQIPEGELVTSLQRRSLPITDKRVVFKLIEQGTPQAWKKCPALRYHRLLVFQNGVAEVDKYRLLLDKELGLRIQDPEEGESED